MATKLVKNVDDDVWRQFTGLCKMKNSIVGRELNDLLKDYVKRCRRF